MSLFSKEQSSELAKLYKKGGEITVIAYPELKKRTITVKYVNTIQLKHVLQRMKVNIIYAPYDYDEFIDKRWFVRRDEIANHLYNEINRRLEVTFSKVLSQYEDERLEEERQKDIATKYEEHFKNGTTTQANQYQSESQTVVPHEIVFQNNKYMSTENVKTLADGTLLYQIMSVKDFELTDGTKIEGGTLGGWLESEINLSTTGSSWVQDGAYVYGDAVVLEDAVIKDFAMVKDRAVVKGQAVISGYAQVTDDAQVMGRSVVTDNARISKEAQVGNRSTIFGRAYVTHQAKVGQYAQVGGDVIVQGTALVIGDNRYDGQEIIT